jgi:hypothetical protein
MRALMVVRVDPHVKIHLQLFQRRMVFLAESQLDRIRSRLTTGFEKSASQID